MQELVLARNIAVDLDTGRCTVCGGTITGAHWAVAGLRSLARRTRLAL
jgi:hypothetical protein